MQAGEKSNKADWYKLSVKQKEVMNFNIDVYSNGYFDFYLYGLGYTKGLKIDTLQNSKRNQYRISIKQKINVTPGTYYIKVVRSKYYNKACGSYQISIM